MPEIKKIYWLKLMTEHRLQRDMVLAGARYGNHQK